MVAYLENHLFSIVHTGDFWLEAHKNIYRMWLGSFLHLGESLGTL